MSTKTLSLSGSLAFLTFAATASLAPADDLFVASQNSTVARVKAEGGSFQVVAACLGSPHASTFDGTFLFLSDSMGNLYKFDSTSGQSTYFLTVPNDACGLVSNGDELLVGGSASNVIRRVSKTTGAITGSLTVTHNVTCMVRAGSRLFVGSQSGLVTGVDLLGGTPSFLGACTGAISSMTAEQTHIFVGTNSGWIFRMNMATGVSEGFFTLDSDCTALAVHGGSLLVAGSDGRIQRVHRITGAPQGSTQWEFDIRAMTVAPTDPGVSSGFGAACPCGNTDTLGGCKNSTWVGAYLGGSGSASISADDLTLSVFNLPSNSFGRIFMGAPMNGVSFGDGLLSVNGSSSGLVRYPVQNSGTEGRFTFGPGLRAFAANNFGAGSQLSSGQSWNFQAYYRDTSGPCGAGFNTTNALRVSFVP